MANSNIKGFRTHELTLPQVKVNGIFRFDLNRGLALENSFALRVVKCTQRHPCYDAQEY